MTSGERLVGSRESIPLVLIHGFMGGPSDWKKALAVLESTRCAQAQQVTPIIAVDLAELAGGILAEAPTDSLVNVAQLADGVLAQIRADGRIGRVFNCCGYSLGGRVAMEMLAKEERSPSPTMNRLLLVSSNPGIADEAARSTRRERDARLASRLLEIANSPHANTRAELCREFLEAWYSQPLFSSFRRHADYAQVLAERCAALATPNAIRTWAAVLAGCSPGVSTSRWDKMDHLGRNGAMLVGACDAPYCAIAAQMRSAGIRTHQAPDSSHAILHEAPRELAEAMAAHFDHANASQLEESAR